MNGRCGRSAEHRPYSTSPNNELMNRNTWRLSASSVMPMCLLLGLANSHDLVHVQN